MVLLFCLYYCSIDELFYFSIFLNWFSAFNCIMVHDLYIFNLSDLLWHPLYENSYGVAKEHSWCCVSPKGDGLGPYHSNLLLLFETSYKSFLNLQNKAQPQKHTRTQYMYKYIIYNMYLRELWGRNVLLQHCYEGRTILQAFQEVQLQHCYRETNKAADFLAKLGHSLAEPFVYYMTPLLVLWRSYLMMLMLFCITEPLGL